MGILSRFSDIVSANINALLDKAEDPAKMVDQYLRQMTDDLAKVKEETAGVMAEESRAKRLADENAAEVEKYMGLAKKALAANNEGDAKVFLAQKQKLEAEGASMKAAYDAARENASKMREMHDKLVNDIETLRSRRESIKAKVAVANTQKRINDLSSAGEKAAGAMDAFTRMEDKANNMLDRANAMTELNTEPADPTEALADKYGADGASASVDDELAALKKEMGL